MSQSLLSRTVGGTLRYFALKRLSRFLSTDTGTEEKKEGREGGRIEGEKEVGRGERGKEGGKRERGGREGGRGCTEGGRGQSKSLHKTYTCTCSSALSPSTPHVLWEGLDQGICLVGGARSRDMEGDGCQWVVHTIPIP